MMHELLELMLWFLWLQEPLGLHVISAGPWACLAVGQCQGSLAPLCSCNIPPNVEELTDRLRREQTKKTPTHSIFFLLRRGGSSSSPCPLPPTDFGLWFHSLRVSFVLYPTG